MSVTASINKLFESEGGRDWQIDGVFDELLWKAAKRSVVFILKEPNRDGKSLFVTEKDEPYLLTAPGWKMLGRWCHTLLTATSRNAPSFDDTDRLSQSHENVRLWQIGRHSSAILNLKKTPGGPVTDDMRRVARFADDHKQFLQQQMKLLKPDIVVCCGAGVFE